MSEKKDLVLQIMDLVAERGWEGFSLADIEGASDHFEDKTDILVAFGRMIDRQVLANIDDFDPNIPPRDLLFDILMERFEALNEYRPALTHILNSFMFDPKQAVISMPYLCHSMGLMLEAAGMDTKGAFGAAKITVATGVYINVLRIWKDDRSPDLAKTMAALDRDLGRAEWLANLMGF